MLLRTLLRALFVLAVLIGVWLPGFARQASQQGLARGGLKNPMDGDVEAIRAGRTDYSARCASCHGQDAKGTDSGSDLTSVWAAGGTDQQLASAIRRGVSNTLLPHSFGPDQSVWQILAYLKTLDAARTAPPAGDAAKGKALFAARCHVCHQVNGSGGDLGPDLSEIGSARSRPLLLQKIRHPSSYIYAAYSGGNVTDGYQAVIVVALDGTRIRGAKKNEDAFSIQIMDTQQRLRGYLKSNLRGVVNETKSLMPEFDARTLSDYELGDLLAYLGTLRETRGGQP